jgi:hypothetical protein
LNSNIPAQDEPANRFLPARHFDAVKNVLTYHDLNPRLGATYNLFGTGKTVLKASLGRYVQVQYPGATSLTGLNNPVTTSVTSATRSWTDSNGNFVPDCDLTNPAAQDLRSVGGDMCGPLSDLNFGKNNPKATQYDPALLHGFDARTYNWETSAEIQHELITGLSVNVGYFRRWYGNFLVTQNLATTPADFDPFCITVPVDSRLPNGGGNQQCGFYDVSVAKFGLTQNRATFASKFPGTRFEHYNGVDLTATGRLHNGAQFSGGATIGRSEVNTCQVINSPQDLLFCDNKPPFQANIKVLGAYPLPWYDLQLSGILQNVPGSEISTTTYLATTSTDIVPTLGRNLSSGAATLVVPLMNPGTLYDHRWTKMDLRVTKTVKIGQARLLGSLDVVNVLNSANSDALNTRYGTSWLQPTEVQGARTFRFAGRFEF